jgi:hypothetical protein
MENEPKNVSKASEKAVLIFLTGTPCLVVFVNLSIAIHVRLPCVMEDPLVFMYV